MHHTLRGCAAETSGHNLCSKSISSESVSQINDQLVVSIENEGGRALLQALIDNIPDFIFVKDANSKFVIANSAITDAYGLELDGLIGKTDLDLHPEARAEEFFRIEQEVMITGVPLLNMEETFPNSRGLQKWYSTSKVPLRNPEGTTIGLIGVARDVTDRKLLEAFGLRQNAILEMIATNAPLATVLNELVLLIESQLNDVRGSILLFDAEAGCLRHGAAPSLPDAYCRIVDGMAIGPKVGSCGTAAYRRECVVVSDIRSDPLWEEYRLIAEKFALRSCWSTPVISHVGLLLGTFAIYSSDVRSPSARDTRLLQMATRIAGIAVERHRSEARLIHMAHYDALTGLPNRVLFLARLKVALARRRAKAHCVALHFIDLDCFKQVNDTLGHHVGDGLLQAVGSRLQSVVSNEHTVARLSGDEFAVIQSLVRKECREKSRKLAVKILNALSLPYDIEGHHLVAGASIGIALAPDDDEDSEALLRDADLALYRAKADERGSVRFFELEMNLRAQQRRALESDLRRALQAGEFELYYQPQVDLATNDVCGFEALLRWNHPQRGVLEPAEFIEVAEELGVIVSLGEWVLRQACTQAASWLPSVKIAVNLSPVQFRQQGLFQTVISVLSSSGLSPQRLELEITESVILHDSDANLALLHQLRTLGVQISLDDFGTGYSSLSYLRSFPFTKIKIDRSFVRDLETNSGCLAIVRAISRLASDLGMRTTVEGVETKRQLEQLRREGCDEVQGFLFSRPIPASEATAMISQPPSIYDAA